MDIDMMMLFIQQFKKIIITDIYEIPSYHVRRMGTFVSQW